MKSSSLRSMIAVTVVALLSGFATSLSGAESKSAAEPKEGPKEGGAVWLSDYQKALAQAKAENKALLLDFTGSDWCGWCIKMVDETLSKKEFADYAAKNLVLVEVDFPNKKQLAEETKKQNGVLKTTFGAQGFPTFVLVDKDGKELGKQVGYMPGGPTAFIAKLESFKAGSGKQ